MIGTKILGGTRTVVVTTPGGKSDPDAAPDAAGFEITGVATQFVVTAPTAVKVGTPFHVVVTAQDVTGKTASAYSGIVHLTSTDKAALLPANAHLTNGVGTFAVTLKTVGAQTVTTTDTVTPTINGTSGAITVQDVTAPTTKATLAPAAPDGLGGYYKSAVTVTLTATDPDNTAGQITTSYSVDGATAKTYTAPFAVAADGSHTVTYHSVDPAGNAETAKTITFKTDATPPVTTVTAAKTAAGEQVTLAAKDAGSGVAARYYSLDGGAQQTYSAPFTVSKNGSHTVIYHSTDKAGNVEAAKTLKVTVAVALPTTTAALAGTLGTNGFYKSAVTITLKTTAGGLPIAKRYYKLDSGASTAYTAALTVAGDTAHTVTFYAVDTAGNTEAAKSVTFTIDAVKPVTTATLVKVATGEQVTLKATDDYSGVLARYCAVDGGAQQTYTAAFTVAGKGAHTVTYHSTDKAGNVEAAKTIKFTNS